MPSFEPEHGFAQSLGIDLQAGSRAIVIGLDEVGRGPWAGPVTAAAAWIDIDKADPGLLSLLEDSKKLTARRRTAIADLVSAAMAEAETAGRPPAVSVAVADASVAEIDHLNILQATFLAMDRALTALESCLMETQADRSIAGALIDGKLLPSWSLPCRAVIGGDGLSNSIALASIMAKVRRDRTMADLARRHPGYGWERNAGYGTRQHQAALSELGPTIHHRRSFKPIKALLDGAD